MLLLSGLYGTFMFLQYNVNNTGLGLYYALICMLTFLYHTVTEEHLKEKNNE